ncbi:MAG: helicase [Lachnospiraceae bacterium]|nr:helicase [Lachnospiraceae bacterium]
MSRPRRHKGGRRDYGALMKSSVAKYAGELITLSCASVAPFLKQYTFPEWSYDDLRPLLARKSLEDLLWREFDGTGSNIPLNESAVGKSCFWQHEKSPGSLCREQIMTLVPELAEFAKNNRSMFEALFKSQYRKLYQRIRLEARNIFYNEITDHAGFRSLQHMIMKEEDRRQGMIIKTLPKRMPDLYPLARKMKRRFVLHVGPTNSGKTYDALQVLKQANRGIYLAPLRLLAYELYDRMNGEGVPCSMITGEEEIMLEGAEHFSATIETLNVMDLFDVAVIDECQMIADEKRGGAWLRAVLGVCANEVHICSDESCVDLVTAIITECGDTYTIMHNERATKLKFDGEERFRFPASVRDRDALIVFSKQSVISVAAELQKYGIRASMIYGNLPYDVRMNEVKRFIEGETSVVVATDAIGMGLNLPIKRIVFLETRKFDGETRRPLTVSEIKQIAGRAGRRGIFDVGYYTSEYRAFGIKKAVEQPVPLVHTARVGIPESIIYLDMPLSEILQRWSEIEFQNIYAKSDYAEEITLCHILEKHVEDKKLLYDLIMIGFRVGKSFLTELLTSFAIIEQEKAPDMEQQIDDVIEKNIVPFDDELDTYSMAQLEDLYLKYDVMYAYLRKFDHRRRLPDIVALKRDCSARIIELLRTQRLETRKCKICGCELPWNYPYGRCGDCFMEERA